MMLQFMLGGGMGMWEVITASLGSCPKESSGIGSVGNLEGPHTTVLFI
jgi:hypothetical protein